MAQITRGPGGGAGSSPFLAPLGAFLGAGGYALGGWIGGLAAVLLAGALTLLVLPFLRRAPAAAPAAPAPEPGNEEPEPLELPPDRIDQLTGLANENGLRAWFAERLPRLVENGRSIVALSASLEGLDAIIAGRGQAVADKVLIEVAKRISVFAGKEGIAARPGGGIFASEIAVVPEHSADFASDTAAKLAELLQRPVELPEAVIWIGGCVGAAAGPAAEGIGVLERSKAALAKAKQIGLGHFVVDAS